MRSSRYGTFFASATAQVNLATPLPDTQGVYAGTQDGKLSLVIVNKNPDVPISFYLANVPTDTYFVRHFGGQAGVAKWQVRYLCCIWETVKIPRADKRCYRPRPRSRSTHTSPCPRTPLFSCSSNEGSVVASCLFC